MAQFVEPSAAAPAAAAPGTPEGSASPLDALRSLTGNECCADCGSLRPEWCSMNNRVLICIRCAGVHRSLGVDHSFVQSLTLDFTSWSPEQVEAMMASNTAQRNAEELEFHVPAGTLKPASSTPVDDRSAYIRAKYVDRAFRPAEGRERLAPVHMPEEAASPPPAEGSGAEASSRGMQEFVGVLSVTIHAGINLIDADVIGVSDPYVVARLGTQRQKTTIKKNNLNPKWDETFMFSWDGRSNLFLQAWDYDRSNADDSLGTLDFSLVDMNLEDGVRQEWTLPLADVPHGLIRFSVTPQFFTA